ncbi:DUF6894 family protein [Methylobacterium sp. JK268]
MSFCGQTLILRQSVVFAWRALECEPCAPAFTEREWDLPRYFFHVYDGYKRPDTEGVELPNVVRARSHAIAFAGRLIAEEADRLALDENWHIDVVDTTGLVLFRLDFVITAAPVVAAQQRAMRSP